MPPDAKRTQLNRALSKLGYCSRTVAQDWIRTGKITVNGKVSRVPEQWVELGTDRIEVVGTSPMAKPSPSRLYLCLHKPADFVTTRSDELGRKTVYDLLPPNWASKWVFPVGRLDKDSEGLLLMTDDGTWANRLTDPEFHVEKTYRVKLDGKPSASQMREFASGIELSGGKTRPARIVEEGGGWYQVTLLEGRNRQIRRMFHDLGYKVKKLIRVAIGPLRLDNLKPGESRVLEPGEVQALFGK